MSIRWIKNVLIDGEKQTLEIYLGDKRIGDKCYTRLIGEVERWFDTGSTSRNEIIKQGLSLLQKRFQQNTVCYPNNQPYDWTP